MKIGLVSDIHEDYASLCAASAALEKAQCDRLVCLGDIVGFSFPFQQSVGRRNADACIAFVRNECVAAVAGNHDLYALRRIPRFTAGFQYGEDWYDLDESTRRGRAADILWRYEDFDIPQQLSAGSVEYLAALPEFHVAHFDELTIFFSHFRYPDLSGSVVGSLRSDHLHEHFHFVRDQNCDLSFSGHGHPEGFAKAENGRLEFNGFGAHSIHRGPHWMVCPAVARTGRASGVMTFDTSTFLLEVIPLHVS
ncbi:MAG: metallophosphoesterase family protein [Bacteroidetes bacterium]|nr:metallophosphoesterase family protein [Bacteroidota bacterium]